MKLLSPFLFIVISLMSSTVFSQEERSSIQLTLLDSDFYGESGVTYTLYQGNDSITSFTTDENGQFYVEIRLDFNSNYALVPINNPDGLGKDHLKFRTIEAPMNYIFEYQNLAVRREHGNLTAYFQQNDTKHIEEFDVEYLLSIITDHPEICIELAQSINRSESEKTALKRRKNFLKHLEEYGVDMSCIQFNDETHFLKVFHEDQRSRIEFAIASLDSKCN